MVISAAVRSRQATALRRSRQRNQTLLLLGETLRQRRLFLGEALRDDVRTRLELAGRRRPADKPRRARRRRPPARRRAARLLLIAGARCVAQRPRPPPTRDDGSSGPATIVCSRPVRSSRRRRRRAARTARRWRSSTLPPCSTQARTTSRLRIASPSASLKVRSRRGGERHRQRAAERAVRLHGRLEQHAEADLVEQLRLRRLVEHLEARRDIGLERKLMQQPRAEGVDGLHLQPARRLQRGREQPARAAHARSASGAILEIRADFPVERGVVERGPLAERVEHAVRHVGGGRLGEGDAEDFLGRDAVEQQPDHALRQHVGLAGAGIGRDPGRHRRVRRLDLQPQHGLGMMRGAVMCALARCAPSLGDGWVVRRGTSAVTPTTLRNPPHASRACPTCAIRRTRQARFRGEDDHLCGLSVPRALIPPRLVLVVAPTDHSFTRARWS